MNLETILISLIPSVIVGVLVGFATFYYQNRLVSEREKENQIRDLKLKVYTNYVIEQSKLFENLEGFIEKLKDSNYYLEYSILLNKIVAPVSLFASKKLEDLIREMFNSEVLLIRNLSESGSSRDKEFFQEMITEVIRSRNMVLDLMKEELNIK